jgi:hypothetical protein
VSFWREDELARFKYFELAGVRSIGTCIGIDVGDGTPLLWDEQTAMNYDGVFLRFKGLGLVEFSFLCRAVDVEDRAAYDSAAWTRASTPAPQGQPQRILSIRHPVLEIAKTPVKQAYILNSPFPGPASNEGGVILSYKFKAYRKQIVRPAKPVAATNKAEGKIPNPRQAQIAALTTLLGQKLAAGK